MYKDFTQVRGIYKEIPTGEFVGNIEQIRHERIGEVVTKWSICVPEIDDRVMIIKRNDERHTILVEDDFEYAWKIRRAKVFAIGGAKGLFECLVRGIGDREMDYHYFFLEQAWERTKSLF